MSCFACRHLGGKKKCVFGGIRLGRWHACGAPGMGEVFIRCPETYHCTEHPCPIFEARL